MAYEDEITAANRLPTREARFAARNAVRAKYGMGSEEKKRGGLAGFYDRNKQLIQAGLPTLAGLLAPGAGVVAGAITGGLARGLDRPGQGGVGLDTSAAARGALAGAGLGATGSAARTGLRKLFGSAEAPKPVTAGNMPGPVPGQAVATPGYGEQIGVAAATPAATPAPSAPAGGMADQAAYDRMMANAGGGAGTAGAAQPGRMGRLLAGFRENAPLIQATATPLAAVIGGSMEQDIEARKIRLQEEQFRREQEARNRLAQLLMPLFQQTASQYAGRR